MRKRTPMVIVIVSENEKKSKRFGDLFTLYPPKNALSLKLRLDGGAEECYN